MTLTTDVLIVGAGPVGLTLANYLGMYGVRTVVAESRPDIIDYPRGVGVDDESLRSFQAIGLIEEVLCHVSPDQWMRFLDAKGRMFASIEPRRGEFGFPKRNAFIQPLVDRVLLDGLLRFELVRPLWSHTLEDFEEVDGAIEAQLVDQAGGRVNIRASYLVGCDGGRSITRKRLGIDFSGVTESTRWLVVDVRNDPLGTPNLYLLCDPARPAVSLALPHGIRRFEFLLFDGESDEAMVQPERMHELVAKFIENPEQADYIRQRVYTHHARIASTFRRGRVLLAGDAAHLMPVWQGQGFNTGIRDATNLGWKLAAVVNGSAGPQILDTYETERRAHAAAMIRLSLNVGRFVSPTNRKVAAVRDAVTRALAAVPPVQRYLLEMRFKPVPRYTRGVVVHHEPIRKDSPVGRLFIQPRVTTRDERDVLLDDVVGPGISVLAWGTNPWRQLDEEARALWQQLGAKLFSVRPMSQLWWKDDDHPDVTLVGDSTGRLKAWFDDQPGSVVILRPDRFVAGICLSYDLSRLTKTFAARLHATGPGSTALIESTS